MSSFSRRRPLRGAPQNRDVASTLPQRGCPHREFVASLSQRSLAAVAEFAVSTLSSAGCPADEFVVCTRPKRRLPERRAGPPPRNTTKLPLRRATSRISVSRLREARFTIPVSQDHKAGPKHGPTVPIFQKPRGCPRDLRNFEPPDPAKKSDVRAQFPRLRSHPTHTGHPSIETAQPTSFPAGQAAPLHRSPARLRQPHRSSFPKR